jgi:cell division septum initiation protein DivIVA
MTEQASKLPRKPFGYDPTVVDQMLSDRDSMLGLAERRVRDAEGKVANLEEQLRAHQEAVTELSERLAVAEAAPPPPPPSVEAEPAPREEESPLTPQFVTDEISKVIAAAESSTSQILERAWVATRDQVLEADRLWREVQAEVVRFAEWRDEAEAVVQDVQSAMDEARKRIEAVPLRIQEALAPVVESMVSVDAGVGKFTIASNLPLLLTPSGLQAARARAEAMGHGDELSLAGANGMGQPAVQDHWQEQSEPEGEWSGMAEPNEADWSDPAGSSQAPATEPAYVGPPEQSDDAADEASQQLREFLGIPGEPRDEEYQAGHPWGA